MPDWLRAAVWIVGVLALLVTLVVGYLMWRYRIPPRGLVAMGAAALYLISPIDLLPEAILGPLGLVDDAGVVAAVVLFVYKLVKARQILADSGIELRRPRRRSLREPDRADRGACTTRSDADRDVAPRGFQLGEAHDAAPSGEFGADERGQSVGAARGDDDAVVGDLAHRVRVGEDVVQGGVQPADDRCRGARRARTARTTG